MAEQALIREAKADAEHYLGIAERGYDRLEELHRNWDAETAADKEDVTVEWGLVRGAVNRLRGLVVAQSLPPELHARYEALLERVERDELLVKALWTRPS